MTVTEADMRVCLDLIDNYVRNLDGCCHCTNDLSAGCRGRIPLP